MERRIRQTLMNEIDRWLDGLEPLPMAQAPEGFAERVMDAVRRNNSNSKERNQGGHLFWQVLAAGVALLVAINIYTALTIQKTDLSNDVTAKNVLLESQSVDVDTYNNYSQLAYDDKN